VAGIQRPLSQRNCESAQVTLTQPVSSEKSPQSFSESHLKLPGIHRPVVHWNSPEPHVGSAQSSMTSLTNLRLAFLQINLQLFLYLLIYTVVSFFLINWEVTTTTNTQIAKIIMMPTLEHISNIKHLFGSNIFRNLSNKNATSKSRKSMQGYVLTNPKHFLKYKTYYMIEERFYSIKHDSKHHHLRKDKA
jgi:hypothetical protein